MQTNNPNQANTNPQSHPILVLQQQQQRSKKLVVKFKGGICT
jgi:hypothetical protein